MLFLIITFSTLANKTIYLSLLLFSSSMPSYNGGQGNGGIKKRHVQNYLIESNRETFFFI